MSEAARAFVAARRAAQGLERWPGDLPQELDDAYALQSEVQAAWGKPTGGVKVGRVLGAWAERFGVDRFAGPICAATIRQAVAGEVAPFPVIAGGTALLECEVIAMLGRDAPDDTGISSEAARGLVASLHIGIEIAGSPMADINALGPLASVACFGNNNGVIIGPPIAYWQMLDLASLHCVARIDGEEAGRGDTARLPGGIWTALTFACAQQARLGRPLKAGDIVCTGALTGMHPLAVGQRAQADFGPLGQVDCLAVAQD
ncbi:2-keto-4-pentenoate hydratase [Novosphingobium terrae]|uniref:2-keto-4-pentenoate hydratase n=1 Tax=Novosphingobium terrae TaxID=2726189 RepID=UPI00197EC7BC|nr:fumarylacetoacetate hydrolase family protein [Novosphingobium terrae]